MATNIGPRIGIDGEAEFRKQIENITAKGKALAAEMQAVATSFGKESDAQEKARATGAVLAKQIENQKQIVNQYAAMVKRSTEVKGEDDATTQKWVAKLNSATAELNRLQEQAKDAANATSDLSDAQTDAGDAAKKSSESWTVFKGIIADLAANVLLAAADGLKNFASGIVQAAADVQASSAQYEQTFGELSAQADSMLKRISSSTGMVETRLRDSASAIYAFARSSGADTSEAMDLTETALQAAADAAAYYDKSMEDATDTLQSFLKGNFENDAALGVSCTETTRNAAAMDLFGKKYTELTEIQKQQTLLKMVTDAQALSGAMGQASREADSWTNVTGNLTERWRQFQAVIGQPVLEKLIPIIKQASEWIGKLQDGFSSGGAEGFVSALQDVAGEATSLLTSALPELATIGGKLLIAIGSGILTNLPAILDAGMQTIAAMMNGISEAMPELIGYLPEIVLGISGALLDNLPLLIDAGIALLAALTEGLIKAMPELLAYTPTIIIKIVSSLLSGVASLAGAGLELIKAVVRGITDYVQAGNIIRIGKNIVEGIWNGISGSLSWIKEKLTGWVGDVLGFLKKLFGINSPSTVMRDEVGKYLGLGVGDGFSESMSTVKRQMQQSLQAATDFSIPGLTAGIHYAPESLATLTSASGSTTNYGGVSINVYAQPGQDVNAVADTVMRKMQTAVERRNAVWA